MPNSTVLNMLGLSTFLSMNDKGRRFHIFSNFSDTLSRRNQSIRSSDPV